MSLESDAELLARFRRGERDALAAVFRMYVADVAATVRAGVNVDVGGQRTRLGAHLPEADIEVLIQDTFVRAFSPTARASYDGVRPYGAYLAVIARNLLIDGARRRRREVRGTFALASAAADTSAPDVGWRIDEERVQEAVRTVRDGLSGLDAQVYRLRFEEERSLRETASALAISVMVVRRVDAVVRARVYDALVAAGFGIEPRVNPSWLKRRRSK